MRSHSVYLFLSGLFHLAQYSLGPSLLVVGSGKIAFFLWQNNIPVSVCGMFSLFIDPLMGVEVVSLSWLLLTLQWICGEHISFLINVFIFLDKHPEVELLDHMLVFVWISWGAAIVLLSGYTMYVPTNSAHGLLFLHIFTNTCYF